MHRHGYQGRKFGRERDQRQALVKGLAESLVIHHSIETTLPKAKELRPYVEQLITKAKKGDLHNRRQVISGLLTISTAHKLVDEVAPKLNGRTSGYLRIEKTALRRGDNTQMAKISFVDDLKQAAAAKKEVKTTKSEEDKKVSTDTAQATKVSRRTTKPADSSKKASTTTIKQPTVRQRRSGAR